MVSPTDGRIVGVTTAAVFYNVESGSETQLWRGSLDGLTPAELVSSSGERWQYFYSNEGIGYVANSWQARSFALDAVAPITLIEEQFVSWGSDLAFDGNRVLGYDDGGVYSYSLTGGPRLFVWEPANWYDSTVANIAALHSFESWGYVVQYPHTEIPEGGIWRFPTEVGARPEELVPGNLIGTQHTLLAIDAGHLYFAHGPNQGKGYIFHSPVLEPVCEESSDCNFPGKTCENGRCSRP